MTSKSPIIPFGIVACTFSDNLSRNSCIRKRVTVAGAILEAAVRIFITLPPVPQTRTQSLFSIRAVMNGRDLVRTWCIKGKSNSPNLVPILERGPVCLIPKRLCARQIFLPYIALQEKATDHWEQVWPCPVASKLAGFLCPAGVLFWLAAPPPKQHSHANPACYPGYLTR